MPLHHPGLDARGRAAQTDLGSGSSPQRSRVEGPRVALTPSRLVTAWARTHGREILFIDGNHFLLEMTARAFHAVGATCRTAASQEEALRSLEEDPGLRTAILDYDMTEGDLGGLVRRLRAIRPSILLIGTSERDRRREFARRGVRRFVGKPWHFVDLVQAAALETGCRGAAPAQSA